MNKAVNINDLDYEAGTRRVEDQCFLLYGETLDEIINTLPPVVRHEVRKADPKPHKPVLAEVTEVPVEQLSGTDLEINAMSRRLAGAGEWSKSSTWGPYYQRLASILHLIDLKRAGHSPAQTELRISHEPGCLKVGPKLAERSFVGSHFD